MAISWFSFLLANEGNEYIAVSGLVLSVFYLGVAVAKFLVDLDDSEQVQSPQPPAKVKPEDEKYWRDLCEKVE